jgi:hypothetical protein
MDNRRLTLPQRSSNTMTFFHNFIILHEVLHGLLNESEVELMLILVEITGYDGQMTSWKFN